jgi:hypothetical protein
MNRRLFIIIICTVTLWLGEAILDRCVIPSCQILTIITLYNTII